MITLIGIPTCDTCRNARRALEAAGHTVTLHDVRKAPLGPEAWAELVATFGDRLVNRRSTTWRGLDEAERDTPTANLLAQHPTLMKRPVLRDETRESLGWDATAKAIWGI